jgi:hypothetical protein
MKKISVGLTSVKALLLTTAIGLSAGPASSAEEAVKKVASTSDGYCHLKIPAARPSTLGNDRVELKSPNTGDIIDFYGPCNIDPTGKDIIIPQKQHRSRMYGKL